MAAGSSSGIERLVATPPLPGFTGDHTHAQHPEQLQQEMKLIRHKLFKCIFFCSHHVFRGQDQQPSCIFALFSLCLIKCCPQPLRKNKNWSMRQSGDHFRYIYFIFFSRKTMSEFGVLRGL